MNVHPIPIHIHRPLDAFVGQGWSQLLPPPSPHPLPLLKALIRMQRGFYICSRFWCPSAVVQPSHRNWPHREVKSPATMLGGGETTPKASCSHSRTTHGHTGTNWATSAPTVTTLGQAVAKLGQTGAARDGDTTV